MFLFLSFCSFGFPQRFPRCLALSAVPGVIQEPSATQGRGGGEPGRGSVPSSYCEVSAFSEPMPLALDLQESFFFSVCFHSGESQRLEEAELGISLPPGSLGSGKTIAPEGRPC